MLDTIEKRKTSSYTLSIISGSRGKRSHTTSLRYFHSYSHELPSAWHRILGRLPSSPFTESMMTGGIPRLRRKFDRSRRSDGADQAAPESHLSSFSCFPFIVSAPIPHTECAVILRFFSPNVIGLVADAKRTKERASVGAVSMAPSDRRLSGRTLPETQYTLIPVYAKSETRGVVRAGENQSHALGPCVTVAACMPMQDCPVFFRFLFRSRRRCGR